MILLLCSLAMGQDGKPGAAEEWPEGGEILTEPVEVEVRTAPDGRMVFLVDPADVMGGFVALLGLLGIGGAARRYGPPMPARVPQVEDVRGDIADMSAALARVVDGLASLDGRVTLLQQQEEASAVTVAGAMDVTALALEQGRHLVEMVARLEANR